jgi:biotin carboxyl carrier protein
MKFIAFVDGSSHDVEVRPTEGGYQVNVDGEERTVDTARVNESIYSLIIDGLSYDVSVRRVDREVVAVKHGGFRREVRVLDPASAAARKSAGFSGPAEIKAVMPGRVVSVLVEPGQEVRAGQGLMLLEAMKMENEVTASRDGVVQSLKVSPGQSVEAGSILAVVEPA